MRWSLGPTALLLADGGNDGEVQPVYVSSVQVRSGRMTDAAIAALGTPTANKIPQVPAAIQARRSGTSVVIDWTGTVLESAAKCDGVMVRGHRCGASVRDHLADRHQVLPSEAIGLLKRSHVLFGFDRHEPQR